MKKKIALLLALSMLISILPMNVFATEGGQLSGLPTGAMWERTLGRATNLRHWNPGVLVALPENLNVFRLNSITPAHSANWDARSGSTNVNAVVVPDAGGNLRSILAAMDYFRDQPDAYFATIRMQLHNAQGFMSSLFYSHPGTTFNFDSLLGHGFMWEGQTAPRMDAQAQLDFLAFFQSEAVVNEIGLAGGAAYNRVFLRELTALLSRMDAISTAGQNIFDATPVVTTTTNAFAPFTAPADLMALTPAMINSASNENIVAFHSDTVAWLAANSDALTFMHTYLSQTLNGILNAITDATAFDAAWRALDPNRGATVVTFELPERPGPTGVVPPRPGAQTFTDAAQMNNFLASVLSALNAATLGITIPSTAPPSAQFDALLAALRAAEATTRGMINDYAILTNFAAWVANEFEFAGRPEAEIRAAVASQFDLAFRQDGTGPNVRTPVFMARPELGQSGHNEFYVALLPRFEQTGERSRTVVDIVLMRTDLNPALTVGTVAHPVPQIRIPIQYITCSRSNNNPVYLTFQHHHQWPQAGEAGSRTDLTVYQESRFNVSLHEGHDIETATPRTFHRYGRAVVPGIRIAEAVQSAFDQPGWWVEIELVTPGFYWTQESAGSHPNRDGGVFHNRFRTRYQTTGQNAWLHTGNDIRTATIPGNTNAHVQRVPLTGNNRFSQLQFPVNLAGVTANPQRLVNDWLQIDDLSIGATDRARVGDVVAEVRLYRLGTEGGIVAGAQGHWSWHVHRSGDGGVTWSPHADRPTDFIDPTQIPAWLVDGPAAAEFPNWVPGVGNANTVQHFPVGAAQPTIVTANLPPNVQYRGEFRWNQALAPGVGVQTFGRGTETAALYADLVVARFGVIGLELFVHPDDDLEAHTLRSGARDWEFVRTVPTGETRPIGAVIPGESDWTEHQTVRAVLRETAPGSLPATGAHPTVFSFDDGIQVLGVRLWANEAHFSAGHDDEDEEVWFGDQTMEADNFLNASIQRNSVTIRPEIGEDANRRWRLAEIWAEFYISVRAGYEHLFGENIDVTVSSGTVELPFEESLTVAYAWDPITVDTTNIVLDENDIEAAFGIVRGVNISDITITETMAGELFVGQRIWVGLEGGISRGWGSADHIALRAASVETTGNLQVSPIQHDSHGIFVEITRGSNVDGAQIIFSGVQVSGRVVPDHQYNIIVADTAVAHNWEGWGWINAQQSDVGFTRGLVRGFFNEEPYVTPAFRFEGAEFYAPIEIPDHILHPTPAPTPAPTPPPQMFAPVTITEWDTSFNSIRVPGRVFDDGPPLILVRNDHNPDFVTGYVVFAVIADLLGIEGEWDPATASGTFSDGVTTVVVTNGSQIAMVNGMPRNITASGLPADARIIDDRFYVPITFFRDVVPEWPIFVQWSDPPGGPRSITVMPRS